MNWQIVVPKQIYSAVAFYVLALQIVDMSCYVILFYFSESLFENFLERLASWTRYDTHWEVSLMADNTYLILFTGCNPLALHAAFDAIAGERNIEEKKTKYW